MSDQTSTATPAVRGAPVPSGTWVIDPAHSRVGFSIRHMGIDTIRGEFTRFEGTLEVGDDVSSATASGSVEVDSIFTNQPQRDEHLRSADFFDVANHPMLTFKSSAIEAAGDESFRIIGEMTLHGVTRELVLRAVVHGTDVDQFGNERAGLEATGEISRASYEMGFNMALSSGVLLLADKVKLALDISAIRQG
jgi:polyisoprenoid-binding protein YceI